jgi:phosphoserine phosphatase
VVVLADARAQISRDLARASGMKVAVACAGPALLVAALGRTFGCSAEVGGVQRQVVVTVTSTTGTLQLRLLPYRPA